MRQEHSSILESAKAEHKYHLMHVHAECNGYDGNKCHNPFSFVFVYLHPFGLLLRTRGTRRGSGGNLRLKKSVPMQATEIHWTETRRCFGATGWSEKNRLICDWMHFINFATSFCLHPVCGTPNLYCSVFAVLFEGQRLQIPQTAGPFFIAFCPLVYYGVSLLGHDGIHSGFLAPVIGCSLFNFNAWWDILN